MWFLEAKFGRIDVPDPSLSAALGEARAGWGLIDATTATRVHDDQSAKV